MTGVPTSVKRIDRFAKCFEKPRTLGHRLGQGAGTPGWSCGRSRSQSRSLTSISSGESVGKDRSRLARLTATPSWNSMSDSSSLPASCAVASLLSGLTKVVSPDLPVDICIDSRFIFTLYLEAGRELNSAMLLRALPRNAIEESRNVASSRRQTVPLPPQTHSRAGVTTASWLRFETLYILSPELPPKTESISMPASFPPPLLLQRNALCRDFGQGQIRRRSASLAPVGQHVTEPGSFVERDGVRNVLGSVRG
jgi:hypothetical protein